MDHSLSKQKKLHFRAISPANNFHRLDQKIDYLYNLIVIFLLIIFTWRCRLAHKGVGGKHQLHVVIDFLLNKACLVKNVEVESSNELDQSTFCECCGASGQTGIVSTNYANTFVPIGVCVHPSHNKLVS